MDVRVHLVESLIAQSKPKTAFRVALCGTGDQMTKGPKGIGVQVKGCGHPMCPRCGRKSAGRYVRRVQGWMAHADHGDLFNVCFTQKAIEGEGVDTARARLSKKLRAFMRWATQQGLMAGMTVHHSAVSGHVGSLGAWHYHAHALLEFPAGRFSVEEGEYKGKKILVSQELAAKWVVIAKRFDGEEVSPLWGHRLLAAGAPIAALREDSGSPDLWVESRDAAARVIQYPMRDLAQGISAWKLGGDATQVAQRVDELCRKGRGWKMRRAWGRWRKKCPQEIEYEQDQVKQGEEEAGADEAEVAAPPGSAPLGTMRRVFLAARKKEEWAVEAMKGLESQCRNNTRFARRLVAWVRAAGVNLQAGET